MISTACLADSPVPPAVTRRLFDDRLQKSGLFVLNVVKIFIDYFGHETSSVLMNAFLWTFFFKGRQWLPVRSYAIEMLKQIPYPITWAYPEAEESIEAFSIFTKKILCSRGICSLKTRPLPYEAEYGLHAIKGNDVFYSLMKSWNDRLSGRQKKLFNGSLKQEVNFWELLLDRTKLVPLPRKRVIRDAGELYFS